MSCDLQEQRQNMCNQWHTLPSEVTLVRMTTRPRSNSLLSFGVGSVQGPGSTLHKHQVAAFSSIFAVVYKVHTLNFLRQPP